jgi:hypothetical protein
MFMFVAGFCEAPTDYIDGKWYRCPAVVTYNENGDTIQIREYGDITEYHYDDNSRKQYRKIYDNSGFRMTTRYSYDSNGRLVEIKSDRFRRTYKRDDTGHVIEEALFIRGRLDGKTIYTYDTEGNKIYQKYTNGKSVVQSETWYNYSDNVMVSSLLLSKDNSYSEINEYYPDGTVHYRKLKFNGKYMKDLEADCGAECVVEQEDWYTTHGDDEKTVWVKYDEAGEVVDSHESTYENEYDSLGRIVRRFEDKFIYFEKGNTVYRCYDE